MTHLKTMIETMNEQLPAHQIKLTKYKSPLSDKTKYATHLEIKTKQWLCARLSEADRVHADAIEQELVSWLNKYLAAKPYSEPYYARHIPSGLPIREVVIALAGKVTKLAETDAALQLRKATAWHL